ncbi:MAG: hypothetical protein M3680_23875 [Myxococcota bacterium]|nr:hypothetical protein [Myxococcota bacterium]
MSDLAFNVNGEPFEAPANAAGWRVRRLKQKGAPEVVYGRDGLPLVLPVDADLDDLRTEVGIAGRYRLDPVDESHKPIANSSAGYVFVHAAPQSTESTTSSRPATDNIAIEAMRMNAEMARTIIDRFPQMMEAAATLLRAADGAGLPARPGMATEGDDDTETDTELAPAGFDLNALVAQVVPLIVMSLGKGKLKLPDLGSVLDWRKASPQKQITDETSNTKQSVDAKSAETALLAPATMAHFIAVQSALKPEEAALAREVAGDLEPAELRSWFDELSKLSVPDAVAKIRTLIGKGGES